MGIFCTVAGDNVLRYPLKQSRSITVLRGAADCIDGLGNAGEYCIRGTLRERTCVERWQGPGGIYARLAADTKAAEQQQYNKFDRFDQHQYSHRC